MNKLNELLRSDPDLRELVKRKSAAILEAETLQGGGDLPAAIQAYGEAAKLEYRVFEYLRDEGLREAALRNIVSCASCWLEAEEYPAARKAARHALDLCGDGDAETRKLCMELLRRANLAATTTGSGGS